MKTVTVIIFLIFIIVDSCSSIDNPCSKIKTEYGYICACNSTYCDTIKQPTKLPNGQFHVYYTTSETPGFNHYTGHFRIQTIPPGGFVLEVNPEKTYQKIRGFGGSFSDSFGVILKDLSKDVQDYLMRSYFSEEGLEYTHGRVVFGCSDFSIHYYTYVPNYDPSLNSFNLTEDDYLYKISPIKRAMEISKKKINLFGCSWFPPEWMKIDGSFFTRYINPKFHQQWADYHIKILDAFKAEGIEIWRLSTQNEPIILYELHIPMGTIIMFPEEQRDWIANYMGPALVKANYSDVKIICMEDQRQFSYWWMETMMRDERASEHVAGVGIHWYFDQATSPIVLSKIHDNFPDKEIFYTEASFNPLVRMRNKVNDKVKFDPNPPKLGTWRRAELLASDLIENFNHWTTMFVDWNLALDLLGGPNLVNYSCDANIIVNRTGDEFYKQPAFYAMGHFAKFFQPEAVVIDLSTTYSTPLSEFTNSSTTTEPLPTWYLNPNLQYVAALNPDGSHSVILLNPEHTSIEVAIHDQTQGYAFIVMEPHSIATVIYW